MSQLPPTGNEQTFEETVLQNEVEREDSQRLSQEPSVVPGQIPGVEVLKRLGAGAFGSVWLGRELNTGRMVAIKFYHQHRGLDWSLLSREVEKLAALDSAREVVRLLDVGWDQDPPYFVMEYLEGGSIAARLQEGLCPVAETARIGESVARGLVHAHGAGVLHCDLKPANILVDKVGEVRLGDFGQSRLSSERSPALGTLYYMAPEQAVLNGVPDARWDVYALGAVMYEMLCGAPPHRSEENDRLLAEESQLAVRLDRYRQIIETSPRPEEHRDVPGIDRSLIEIIDGCLEPDPQLRIANAQIVVDLFEKRALRKTQRPLIWLGFLGPLLFLCALIWIGTSAVPQAVNRAKSHLFDRALASNAMAVRILAGSVQQELQRRQHEMEPVAEVLAARPGEDEFLGFRLDLQSYLDRWHARLNAELAASGRTPDESLFLVDRNGIQVYRNPWNETIGVDFSYRDYYHGRGLEYDPATAPDGLEPRRTAGVCRAFRSRATGQYMVAIVTPVLDTAGQEVIGILGRTIHLTDLLRQWEDRIRAGQTEANVHPDDLFLSLVDSREQPAHLLDHRWMEPANMQLLRNDKRLKSILEVDAVQLAKMQSTDRDANYTDPLADVAPQYAGTWLAAFAPVGETGWIAVVQERRDEAARPMQELYHVFLEYGVWALGIFAAAMTLLWGLIQRSLRA